MTDYADSVRDFALRLADKWESEGKEKYYVDYLRRLAGRSDLIVKAEADIAHGRPYAQ